VSLAASRHLNNRLQVSGGFASSQARAESGLAVAGRWDPVDALQKTLTAGMAIIC
jgi:hypothetical protein